jgi:hypothetical protein
MGYKHVHVSEVPDNPVVECTIAAGLELARAALNGKRNQPPATAAEREKLRVACGVPDNEGASIADLSRGLRARYGLVVPPIGLPSNLATLPEGTFLAVQGNYHDLPAPYQRWDRHFAAQDPAGHCVTLYKLGGILHWCDPLAPWGPYTGDVAVPMFVDAYFRGLPGAHCARVMLAAPPPAPPRYRVSVDQSTPLYDKPSGTVVGHVTKATYTCTRSRSGGHWWYRIVNAGTNIGHYMPAEPWMKVTKIP